MEQSQLPPPIPTPQIAAPEEAESLLMSFLNPSPTTAIITSLIIFLTPIFLHFVVFRSRATKNLPSFLLLGPSGAGKTALMTSFADGNPAETRASQTPHSLEADIPATLTSSSKYRSDADPSLAGHARFMLQDTPGHGKLRTAAIGHIPESHGLIFMVDSSSPTLGDAAEYLHSALVSIQKLQAKKTGINPGFPVLIACNKSDLFTALPAAKIKTILEAEITKVREARSRGVVGVGEEEKDEDEWLGEGGSGSFAFEQLEDAGIVVQVKGGTIKEDGWKQKLGEWVGESL